MNEIQVRLTSLLAQIKLAEQRYHRDLGSVKLLLVSKGQSVAKINQAVLAGQKNFGENYLQEALEKITQLSAEKIVWHYIGGIQTNKTKSIADNFQWVHSVCRLKIAQRLNDQRSSEMPPLNVCLQVNIDNQPSKEGANLIELPSLAFQVAKMPHLKLRGLMAIPAPANDFLTQRRPYQQLREAFEKLQTAGLALDTLSIGMSDDFEAAIAEGATMLRIGAAVFGRRE